MSAIIKYLLLFFLISTSFNISIYGGFELSELSTLLLFIACCHQLWVKKSQLLNNRPFLILSMLFLLGIAFQAHLSYVSEYAIESFKLVLLFFIFYVIGISLALINVNNRVSFYKDVLKIISFNFIFILIVCGIQFIAPSFYHSLLNLVKDSHFYQWKSVAFYTHPNEFAYAIVLQSFFVLILLRQCKINLLTYLPFYILTSFFVYLSNSRNGWIGIVIISIFFLSIILKGKQIKLLHKFGIGTSVVLFFILFGFSNNRINNSVQNLLNAENTSLISKFKELELERFLIWDAAINQITEEPITGKGHRYFLNKYSHIALRNPKTFKFEFPEVNDEDFKINLTWNTIPYASEYKLRVGRISFKKPEYEFSSKDTSFVLDSIIFGEIYQVSISTKYGSNKSTEWSEPRYIITPSNHPDDVFNYITPSFQLRDDSICLTIESTYKLPIVLTGINQSYEEISKIKNVIKTGTSQYYFPAKETQAIKINKRTFRLDTTGKHDCDSIRFATVQYSTWNSITSVEKKENQVFRYKPCHEIVWKELEDDTLSLYNSETYEFQSLSPDNTWSKSRYYSTLSKIPSTQLRSIDPEFIVDNEMENKIILKVESDYIQKIDLTFIDYDYNEIFNETLYLNKGVNKFEYPMEEVGSLPLAGLFNGVTFLLPETIHEEIEQKSFNAHNLLFDLILSMGLIGCIWLLVLFFYIYLQTKSRLVFVTVFFLFGSLFFDNMTWSPIFPAIWSLIFAMVIIPMFETNKKIDPLFK